MVRGAEGLAVHPRAVSAYPGAGEAILMVLAVLLLQLGIGGLLAVGAAVTGGQPGPIDPALAALGNLVAFGVVIGWGYLRARAREGAGRPVFPLAGGGGSVLALALLGAVGLAILSSEIDNLTRWFFPMPSVIAELMAGLFVGGVGSFLLLVVVAPVTEELLFRGLIQRGFLGRYRKWPALLAASALFALLHINPYQLASGFLIGVYLGWLLAGTGSLVPALLGHAVVNALALLAGSDLVPDIPGFSLGPQELAAGSVEFQPWWLDLLGAALLGAAVAGLRRSFPATGEPRLAAAAAAGEAHELT